MLQDNLEMTQSFLRHVTREFHSFADLTPLDDNDIWPTHFLKDKMYLGQVIEELKKESKSAKETVRSHLNQGRKSNAGEILIWI